VRGSMGRLQGGGGRALSGPETGLFWTEVSRVRGQIVVKRYEKIIFLCIWAFMRYNIQARVEKGVRHSPRKHLKRFRALCPFSARYHALRARYILNLQCN
jgi:hypothetical protein